MDKNKKKAALEKLNSAKFGKSHVQAIMVAGSGFFCDSYDNFVIGLIVPMIAWETLNKNALDPISDGWVKAASSYGNVCGQFGFAILGDILGRKRMYGIELVILIFGALGCALGSWPTGSLSLVGSLAIWRFILGVGIGGDYPVSAVITSEFASSARRGQMIATVFAMQGFGIITGALISIITLQIFKGLILEDYHNVTYVWRIITGFGAVPALSAVYFRLKIPETPRYAMDVLKDEKRGAAAVDMFLSEQEDEGEMSKVDDVTRDQEIGALETYKLAFKTYFSKPAHLKILVGCAMAWFFVDIGYYGTSLNTTTVLGYIGYGSPVGNFTGRHNELVFDDIWNRCVGNIMINLAGTVPGYWFTVAFVESWGRKPIQFMGFGMLTLIFLFMGVFYTNLTSSAGSAGFIVLYAFAQFFFNFGPNATTFIIPAEAFPTNVRSTGHGISAASGKIGAIIAAQGFAPAKNRIGVPGLMYIFFSCCFVGGLFTFLVPETKGLTLEEITDMQGASDTVLVATGTPGSPKDGNDAEYVDDH